jgi:hypothetical protein
VIRLLWLRFLNGGNLQVRALLNQGFARNVGKGNPKRIATKSQREQRTRRNTLGSNMKTKVFIDYIQNKCLKLCKEGVRCHVFWGVSYAKLKYHFENH